MFRKTIDVVLKNFTSGHATKILVEKYQLFYVTVYKKESLLPRVNDDKR